MARPPSTVRSQKQEDATDDVDQDSEQRYRSIRASIISQQHFNSRSSKISSNRSVYIQDDDGGIRRERIQGPKEKSQKKTTFRSLVIQCFSAPEPNDYSPSKQTELIKTKSITKEDLESEDKDHRNAGKTYDTIKNSVPSKTSLAEISSTKHSSSSSLEISTRDTISDDDENTELTNMTEEDTNSMMKTDSSKMKSYRNAQHLSLPNDFSRSNNMISSRNQSNDRLSKYGKQSLEQDGQKQDKQQSFTSTNNNLSETLIMRRSKMAIRTSSEGQSPAVLRALPIANTQSSSRRKAIQKSESFIEEPLTIVMTPSEFVSKRTICYQQVKIRHRYE